MRLDINSGLYGITTASLFGNRCVRFELFEESS